jgi:signal transduction histidine kinase
VRPKPMSLPNSISIPASSQFLELCQSQVTLLIQGLGAGWCAVYLAEELADNVPNLVPAFVYPEGSAQWPSGWIENPVNPKRLLASALPEEKLEFFNAADFRDDPPSKEDKTALNQGYQIVLPLIYQQNVMGLLVARRKERKWKKQELIQIEQIARTLAIACLLDRRQGWSDRQLRKQLQLQHTRTQILDDWLHQIRNPLTALRTFGKLLLKRFLPEDRNRTLVESILRESDRLQEFLEQFDDYVDSFKDEIAALPPETIRQWHPDDEDPLELETATAPTSNPLKLLPGGALSLEPLDLTALLKPLAQSADAIAQERGLTLQIRIPPNLPPIRGDRRALGEVLNNLLDNALKYTPRGGRVTLEAGQKHPLMQGIAISDTGPGIPPEDRARLFERHYRGVQARSDIPGTGLGLAIAKEWVEQMQGQIEIISPAIADRANSNFPGTTFIVWLPLASAENQIRTQS